jgi:acyl-CoA-dependent ceramide synthase
MVGLLKYYYLLQFSYWLQQMLILIAKIEKPRKDYRELVIHVRAPFSATLTRVSLPRPPSIADGRRRCRRLRPRQHWVTLWLIGWSYAVNLTMIGNAVFITMDVSDVFLAIAKCVNYAEGKKSTGFWSTVCFAWFVVVWTYLRHWLNIRILWSVWNEFDLIP